MIEISKANVMNWEAAIRGMRNPMNSWDMSDSKWNHAFLPTYDIGEKDLTLMKKLAKSGSDHRKFMRQIFVSVDIKAPLYWWKEFDTYKVGTVANSCSTMHKIHAKEFTLDDFSDEKLSWYAREILELTIDTLNVYRRLYVNWDYVSDDLKSQWLAGLSLNGEYEKKMAWEQMIQLLPSSYNQLRTVAMNYENLVNIYHARKNHKLDEWHVLCDWIESLPYSEIITGKENG